MLMLAQKTTSGIEGIELEKACFDQLSENVDESLWKDRIQIYHGDVRSYPFPKPYDFIITNPPFFENELASQDEQEKSAKHSRDLSLKELITAIDKNLAPQGSFGILLPFKRWEYFNSLASLHEFNLSEKVMIRHSADHEWTRVILEFRREPVEETNTIGISIHQAKTKSYTEEFIQLMKDYYLHL